MALLALCSIRPTYIKPKTLATSSLLLLATLWALLGCASGDADAQGAIAGYAEAAPILASKCVRCHSEPLANGAPFALDTYEQVYERRVDVERVLVRGIMPLLVPNAEPPVEDLTRDERADLVLWLQAGAPK